MLQTQTLRTVSATEAIAITLRVALEHHNHGRLHEAAALYREVQSMDAQNPDALFLLGLIALTVRNDAAAHQLLRVAARRLPHSAHVHNALGQALSHLSRPAEALESYWRALRLDACNPSAYVHVAEALVAVKPCGGNHPLAVGCFRRALYFDPAHAAAHAGLRRLTTGHSPHPTPPVKPPACAAIPVQ